MDADVVERRVQKRGFMNTEMNRRMLQKEGML
jgi:hypothetical protein